MRARKERAVALERPPPHELDDFPLEWQPIRRHEFAGYHRSGTVVFFETVGSIGFLRPLKGRVMFAPGSNTLEECLALNKGGNDSSVSHREFETNGGEFMRYYKLAWDTAHPVSD